MFEAKLVVVGPGGVGKSALTIRAVQDFFVDEYDPTVEDTYRKQLTVDEEEVMLDILDTAGQDEYTTIRDHYLQTGDGFLLVYAIDSKDSLQELKLFHKQVLRAKDADAGTVPIVLVGNKSDLEDRREVTTKEAHAMADLFGGDGNPVPFFETSAKDSVNVLECFHEVVREIQRRPGFGASAGSSSGDDRANKKKKKRKEGGKGAGRKGKKKNDCAIL